MIYALIVIITVVVLFVVLSQDKKPKKDNSGDSAESSFVVPSETSSASIKPSEAASGSNNSTQGGAATKPSATTATSKPTSTTTPVKPTPTAAKFDLFSYCKEFAIKKGKLNGDYCIYQQPSTKYGGYDNEYFSISYWSDSDMLEFCLHCPLDDTLSINFYLRMRGGYNGKYEYLTSKYYRDNCESLRMATGYIDPKVFSTNYPIPCDEYEGSVDGQTEFMEESRVGVCDLICCLKQFVSVENMECDFSAFEFKNF